MIAAVHPVGRLPVCIQLQGLKGDPVLSEGLRNFLFTSESVTEGHPDKIADQSLMPFLTK